MPIEGREGERRGRMQRHARLRLAISRLERLCGEQAQDIGEQQLLVLLLVIDAELDQWCGILRQTTVE